MQQIQPDSDKITVNDFPKSNISCSFRIGRQKEEDSTYLDNSL